MPSCHPIRQMLLLAALALVPATATGSDEPSTETATFGGGCYWCVEAVFQRIKGVQKVSPGFMGGHIPNPTYQQVLTGRTGHAEVVQIEYDPNVVSFPKLLEVFWGTHDPTTLNRQGPDFGTQYRSVVFCHSREQKATARQYKAKLNRDKVFGAPVVTAVENASKFYIAGADHLDYYNRNPDKQYCQATIAPKLKKLKQTFAEQLKPDQ